MGVWKSPVEDLVISAAFWQNKRVFVTGHTGFKGAWLCLWLQILGARVTGYALAPPTSPNLFDLAGIASVMSSINDDVRDLPRLREALAAAQPQVVIHMAAQSLVRQSYLDPVGTYATNVSGTVNLLEAVRHCPFVKVAMVVTSDKCYENKDWARAYREDDALGGYDPYSSSKGCAELVTAAYRRSFWQTRGSPACATVRAGNVIGGGDWAADRLVPDAIAAFTAGHPVMIRNPEALRPWQHVLDPLAGYLQLAERLWDGPPEFASAWNFGPADNESKPVSWVVGRLARAWGGGANWKIDGGTHPHEAGQLRLDCSKARTQLGWRPRVTLELALDWAVEWHRAYVNGGDMRTMSEAQILRYQALA